MPKIAELVDNVLDLVANELEGVLTDEEILKAAHAFWFADKDYKGKNKIWCYMAMVHGL